MEELLNGRVPANPEQYMFSFYEKGNKDFPNNKTITFMGKEITVKELLEKRELYAKGLLELGVQPGEVVSVCMPSTPESVILLYAINEIGAVSNFVNILKDEEYIKHCINNVDSKLLICFDGTMNKILPIIDKTKLDNVVYLSAFESLPYLKKQIISYLAKKTGKIPGFVNDGGYKSWNDFVLLGNKSDLEVVTPEFHKNQAGFIEYTSGTTKAPKAIELTNESANQKAVDYSYNKIFNTEREEHFLNIIPLFVAYGIIMGAHGPMSLGLNVEQVLAYKKEDIFKYFKKQPEHWFLTPASFSYMINDPRFKKLDFSKTKTAGCGGDALSEGQCIITEAAMKEQGLKYPITNGFGASELGAPFSTCTWCSSKPGSVGLPYDGNELIIFKEGTKEILGPNEIGDMCLVGKYPMNGYYKNQELTDEVMLTLDDGRKAIMLGDMGYYDEDGYVFVKGRKTDRLVSNIGNIWPIDVESFIMSTGLVKFCAVSNNKVPGKLTAYLEIDEKKKEEILFKLRTMFLESKEYGELNIEFNVVDNLPLTFSGKIDRKALKVNNEENTLTLK